MKTLRLILGDQLNEQHSWFTSNDENVTYVLMEVKSETNYVVHHIQKVVGIFSAMRLFAKLLSDKGHNVIYLELNHPKNLHSFTQNIELLIQENNFQQFEFQLPDEWRLDEELKKLSYKLRIPTKIVDSEHFFTTREELKELFKDKKEFLMETFYRVMRKKHEILVENGKPIGGKWNFDQENRKKIPENHRISEPKLFQHDVQNLVQLLEENNIKTIGTIDSEFFLWPVNRSESLELLDFFIENCLPLFGTLQDAMTKKSWSIYHARISFSLNIKLISPKEVIEKVIEYWNINKHCTINQIEGFVRQIVGWREYMRGIYWAKMPEYKSLNYFQNTKKLPEWFWTGKTKMNCLQHAISQSLEHAYAHHIQRLMVTGNFALLAGIHPDEVDNWYLGIYIDAFEWVEITNTRGMSQYADGGIVGSKPYISSAAYIDKMSDYCKNCHYKSTEKVGEIACPFNSLYWNFYDKHQEKLRSNFRLKMMYSVWDKMAPEQKEQLLIQANHTLTNIENL